jgi:DNA repair exonuclease SbcCD ATPase subunit
MRAQVLAEIPELERLVAECQKNLQQLQPDIDAVNFELGRAEEVEKQRSRLSSQRAEILAKLGPLKKQLDAERDFLHLIGREGFLGSIFDEVLEEIGAETNDVLASIANTRHCTLEFKSETMTQKGTVRREIVPVVTINGHKASLKFGPSGGMLSAIELAVDLAVGAVISRRTGVCPGWLILDESFDGLGPVEKETCLEILQKYAHDRLVIVVDHASETQGLFTQRITVEYSGGKSRIC